MSTTDKALTGWLKSIATGLKSSYLVMFVAGLFALDSFIPDPLPFLDEAAFFVMTILLARWKGAKIERAKAEEAIPKPPPKDITPPSAE